MSSSKGLVLLALVVAVLAAALLATSLGLVPSSLLHDGHTPRASSEVLAADREQPPSQPVSLSTHCLPSPGSQSSPATLQQMLFRARQHAEQQRYDDALAEFRNIATLDPAVPGIHLNISMALMQLKRVEDAKTAIDAQLATSDCLAKLPPADFATYCRSEMSSQSTDTCRQQTQDVRRTAHMQAALVEMELGRSLQTGAPRAVALSAPQAQPQPQPREEALRPSTASPAKHPAHLPDQSLATGTGTDTALGAYSK